MSPPVWLHCGDCGTQGTGRWFLSSCGRIVCKDCHPQLSVNHCQACRGPCSRTVELTSRSPPDVKNLFSDPSDLIKPIVKTLDFQEKHKRNFLARQTKRLAALDAKQKELLKQKEVRITAIEKAKMRLAQLHRDIAEKKEFLRNGVPKQWSSRDHPVSQSSLYNHHHHHCDFFQTPKKRQDETYGVNDGGFLQLKTPGVFHGEKEDRPRVKDPVKKRSKTSTTGDHIFERLDNSSEKPLREKIKKRSKTSATGAAGDHIFEELDNSSEKPLREKIKMRQRHQKHHSFFSPDYDKYDPNNPQRCYKY